MSQAEPRGKAPEVGLCARCSYRRWLTTARGTRYLFCRYSREDPAFRRYPELPVRECTAHVVGDPDPDPPA